MDSIEQAIRNALGKGNAEDPAFRERVYRSAQAALERAVLANQSIPADAVARRRRHFIDTISRIEADFRPAVAPEQPAQTVSRPAPPPVSAQVQPAPGIDPPGQGWAAAPPSAPSIDVGEMRGGSRPAQRAGRTEPAFGDEAAPAVPAAPVAEPPPVRRERERAGRETYADGAPAAARRRRGIPWGTITGLTTLLVVVGLGYWTVVELDLVNLIREQTSTQRPAPGGNAGSTEAPARPGNNDPLAGWLPVFAPSDPTTVAASPGARAEVVTDDGRQVMRISSGDGGAALRFDIGAGVLERLAGKRAVFDIVAAANGEATQMSVTCALAKLENCGRNRYMVGVEQSEYLFEVDVPEGAGRSAGAIEIVSDVTEGGKAIDIVEIRVSTVEAQQ